MPTAKRKQPLKVCYLLQLATYQDNHGHDSLPNVPAAEDMDIQAILIHIRAARNILVVIQSAVAHLTGTIKMSQQAQKGPVNASVLLQQS